MDQTAYTLEVKKLERQSPRESLGDSVEAFLGDLETPLERARLWLFLCASIWISEIVFFTTMQHPAGFAPGAVYSAGISCWIFASVRFLGGLVDALQFGGLATMFKVLFKDIDDHPGSFLLLVAVTGPGLFWKLPALVQRLADLEALG